MVRFMTVIKVERVTLILVLIYLLTAIGYTPGGSSTVHIYTQTIHRTTQLRTHRTTQLTTNCNSLLNNPPVLPILPIALSSFCHLAIEI